MAGETTRGRGRVGHRYRCRDEKHRQVKLWSREFCYTALAVGKKKDYKTKKQSLQLERGRRVGRLSTSRQDGNLQGPRALDCCRRSRRFQVSFDHQLDHDARPPSAQRSFSPRRIDSKTTSARLWTERIQTCCLPERWRATRLGSTEAEGPQTKTTTASRRRRISPRRSGRRP